VQKGKNIMKSKLAILTIVALLSGCSGIMNGMIRNSGDRVTISYQQGMLHDDLRVVLPGGETFKGKAVMVGSSSGIGYGFGSASATSTSGKSAHGTGTAFSVIATYTGSMQAVLFGDRGHTMRCKFQYADSGGNTSSGGVGICETSDGKVIDVQW